MDIKGSVGPREIKSEHQLLCPRPGVSNCQQLTLRSWWMQSLCVGAALRVLLSLLVEAVKQKVLHRGWRSRSVNSGAERWQPLRRKEEHSAFSEGSRGRMQPRHAFINVATCEMPRIVPKFISALSWSGPKDPSRSASVTFTGLGLKTGRVL